MASEKLEALVSSLLKRTQNGSIEWQPGPRDDQFVWSGTTGTVILFTKDQDGRPPYGMTIIDRHGVAIESVAFGEKWPPAASLYEAARSKARGIDQTLDELLRELGS